MKEIAWITDTTATLPKHIMNQENVYVIPMNIIFGEESFKEEFEITAEVFYEKLKNSKDLPKTSQPAIGEFVELYEKIKKEYKHAIAVHATSQLTGTYQSSVTASKMAEFDVCVIDSKIGSYPLGLMLEKGLALEKEGKSYEEITSYLKTLPDKARLYFSPGSLEQLHKGGRLSGTGKLIGNLLQIKLLIEFKDGKIAVKDKIRTEKKVKKALFSLLEQAKKEKEIKEVSVIHANVEDIALTWKEELKALYPDTVFTTTMFSPIPGSHTGEGTLGLAWIENM